MDCVLDASISLARVLPDEHSSVAVRFMDRFLENGGKRFIVPVLWWHETSNALVTAYRRRRIKEIDLERISTLLAQLPIETDSYFGPEAAIRHRMLSLRHNLSIYDCVYLELAQRRGIGLATLDGPLAEVARAAGLTVF